MNGSCDWKGFIHSDNMPHILNPTQGYILSSNHGTQHPEDGGIFTGGSFIAGHRGVRILNLLKDATANRRFTVEDAQRIQKDTVSQQAIDILPTLLKVATSCKAATTESVLKKWREIGNMAVESRSALAYQYLWRRLVEHYLYDAVGVDTESHHTSLPIITGNSSPLGIARLFNEGRSYIEFNIAHQIDLGAQWVCMAFQDTDTFLAENPDATWGDFHQARFPHPFGGNRNAWVASIVDHVVAMAGDGNTPAQCGTRAPIGNEKEGLLATGACPSARFVADMINQSHHLMMPPGNAGDPRSVYFSDQLEHFLDGKYNTMTLTT